MTAREIIELHGEDAIRAHWDGNHSQASMRKWLGCSRSTVRHLQLLLGLRCGVPNCQTKLDSSPPEAPRITTGNEREIDGHAVLDRAIHDQPEARERPGIELPAEPCAIAILSDLHVGSAGVDYAALARDVQTIHDTPGMYAMTLGDLSDNWLPPGLARLQREQIMQHREELALVRYLLRQLGNKLLVCISGNHDLWTLAFGGVDVLRESCPAATIYRRHEVVVPVTVGECTTRYKLRHQWRGNSIYNETHAIERAIRFGGEDFDVGVGGHTHRGTIIRPFTFHRRRHMAVMVGAYKVQDDYQQAGGWTPQPDYSRGAAALVCWPDGRMMACDDLTTASQFLRWARQYYKSPCK